MPYIAARFTHFPHYADPDEEVKSRGHGVDILLVARVVAEYNDLWRQYYADIITIDELAAELGVDTAAECAGDLMCAEEAAIMASKLAIAERLAAMGYTVFWVYDIPFVVVNNGIILGIEVSPHDDDMLQFHFIFVTTDLPLPVLRKYLPHLIDELRNGYGVVIDGVVELVYDLVNDEIFENDVPDAQWKR